MRISDWSSDVCSSDLLLARRTAAAPVAPRHRRRQIERRVDRPQKQPTAMLAADQIGVLALPAEPRRGRQWLFHHRRGVDEHLDLGVLRFADQPARDALQRPLDDVMIVAALRSEEHTSELQSLMRTSYAVFCLT